MQGDQWWYRRRFRGEGHAPAPTASGLLQMRLSVDARTTVDLGAEGDVVVNDNSVAHSAGELAPTLTCIRFVWAYRRKQVSRDAAQNLHTAACHPALCT